MLGVLGGAGGNLAKLVIGNIGHRLKVAEVDGPDIAAGMFIPPHRLAVSEGKIVGVLGDFVIAGILGVSTVYLLSLTGKNHAAIKGAIAGQFMWQELYGMLATAGVTRVNQYSPKTVLNEFLSHTVYGLVTATLAAKLGDEGLFNGEIPLTPFKEVSTQPEDLVSE